MSIVINLKADTGLVDRTENTERFYEDIRRYPTLTREEEIKWFNLLHNGTPKQKEEARDYIIKCNLRLVIAVAKKWAKTDTLMDYTNEAAIGLMEAINSFDETKGVKFCSFAIWYLKRAINHYNTEHVPIVKRTNLSKTHHVIAKAINDFFQQNERAPSTDELLDVINKKYKKNVKDKNDLLEIQMTRIDAEAKEEEEYALSGITDFNEAYASVNKYEKQATDMFNKRLVSALLSNLTEREKLLIELRFGLCDDNGLKREHELSEIADRLGITKERARQIEIEALQKMTKAYQKKHQKG